MRPFEVLEKSALMDALAEYTARYTKLLATHGKEKDRVNCDETIQSLIREIELRNATAGSTPTADVQKPRP